MKIGKLAKLSDCPIQTIRYYEKERLIDPPRRSEGNFRLYDTHALSRLKFIKHCRTLGITLGEIRQLLDLQKTPSSSCKEVTNIIDNRLEDVVVRIKELQQLEIELQNLRTTCSNETAVDECGILENLSSPL